MFILMTWTSVGMALLKSFTPPAVFGSHIFMECLFVLFAILVTFWALRLSAKTS
jgi:hypothetical protein